jgi:integrase
MTVLGASRPLPRVWCFCVLKKYGLKTANSERTIPLHPIVIEAGFLAYVASLPEGSLLFPGYTEHNIFHDLAAFYDRLGIAKRFYSLRHTVTTHFRFRTDIDGDVKNYLMAHGKKDAHAKYGRYPADKLLPAIERIPVP